MSARSVVVEIWDASLQRVALRATSGIAVSATRTLHGTDTATLTAPPRTRAAELLRTTGSCVRIIVDGELFTSGRIVAHSGALDNDSTVTATVSGHWARLAAIIAYPNPAAPLAAQPAHYSASGPQESVVKDLITSQSQRLGGHVITAAASQGRGPTFTIKARYQPLSDVIKPIGDDEYPPVVYRIDHRPPHGLRLTADIARESGPTLDADAPPIVGGRYEVTADKATRVIVGGAGEGDARAMLLHVADNEGNWRSETFADARDAQGGDAHDVMMARAIEAIAEAAGSSYVHDSTIVDAGRWRWPRTHDVGDRITIKASWGESLTATIRTIELRVDAGDGVRVTASLGNATADPWAALVRERLRDAVQLRRLTTS